MNAHIIVFCIVLVVYILTGDAEHALMTLFASYAVWYKLVTMAYECEMEETAKAPSV
jgi:hypothetical protein